jgi:hypothetical protein
MLEDSRRLSGIPKLIPPLAPLYNSHMTGFRVGDLVRISKHDILRRGDAGILVSFQPGCAEPLRFRRCAG